jgi:hypothetical protein
MGREFSSRQLLEFSSNSGPAFEQTSIQNGPAKLRPSFYGPENAAANRYDAQVEIEGVEFIRRALHQR